MTIPDWLLDERDERWNEICTLGQKIDNREITIGEACQTIIEDIAAISRFFEIHPRLWQSLGDWAFYGFGASQDPAEQKEWMNFIERLGDIMPDEVENMTREDIDNLP